MRKAIVYLGISMMLALVATLANGLIGWMAQPDPSSNLTRFPFEDLGAFLGLCTSAAFLGLFGWLPFTSLGRYCAPRRVAKITGVATLSYLAIVTPFSPRLGLIGAIPVCLASLIYCSEKCRTSDGTHKGGSNLRMGVKYGLLALIVLPFYLLVSGSSRPTQEELTARFHEHYESYDRLRTMLLEDGYKTVLGYGSELTRDGIHYRSGTELGITEERIKAYNDLMRQTDSKRIDLLEDGSVSISMAGWGMANRGWRINLVWRPSPPSELLASIDDFVNTSKDWQSAYSPVADDWYLRIIW